MALALNAVRAAALARKLPRTARRDSSLVARTTTWQRGPRVAGAGAAERKKEKGVRRERREMVRVGNPKCGTLGRVWMRMISGNTPTGIKLILTSTNGLAGKASVGIKEG